MLSHDSSGINEKWASGIVGQDQKKTAIATNTFIFIAMNAGAGRKFTSSYFSRGKVEDFSFFDCSSRFYIFLIEFHCNFSITRKIIPGDVYYYYILIL